MKIITIKTAFLFSVIALSANFNASAHLNTISVLAEEPQEFMLIDNKISFSVEQVDFESIKVESTEYSGEFTKPKFILSEDNKIITLDFTDCEEGSYLIKGTRGDLVIEYLVAHKK